MQLPSSAVPTQSEPGQGLLALAEQGYRPRTLAFIGGAFAPAGSGATFDDVSPIDGTVIAQVAACDADDVDRAVAVARSSFEDGRWRRQSPRARKRVLLALADLVDLHAAELALLETIDVGKPIIDSATVDVPAASNTIRWYGEAIDKVYGEIAPTGHEAIGMVTREPIGVVGAIVPWNFPLYMATWKVAPALATGNSVVLKPSERSPLSALRLAELALEAGLPDGVLNVVPGLGSTAGRALSRHADVDALAFTGSTTVGRQLLRDAGESNLKRVSLELGGKTPHIVLADAADLEAAAQAAVTGIFFNQGQVCNAGSRLLVAEPVFDRFLERILQIAAELRVGDPLDPATQLGALIDEAHVRRVEEYVALGVREGARLVAGGGRLYPETGGAYLEPTVFTEVDNRSRLAQEEIFGPVLSVIRVAGAEEAVRIANDSPYGLAAAVWSQNIDTALNVAANLRAGVVWVNNFDESDVTTPWGGYKQSGTGRDKSLHAIESYTELKTTWIRTRPRFRPSITAV